jgi:cytoskeletal protein RodZ
MSIGAQLRTAREAKGLSLESIAKRTRVKARTLQAIELNDQSALPPRPYGRGFVRAYAEEVNLDPDRTVREYFAQFPPSAPPPQPIQTRELSDQQFDLSSHWSGLATAAAIFVLVVTTAVALGRRDETPRESNVVGTAGAAPSAKPEAAPQPAKAEPASAAKVVPAQRAPLSLEFSVDRPCWVTAHADGKRTIYRTLQAGERGTVNGEKEIAIRFGDASAVTWSINGRAGDRLGESGVVRDLTITPENASTLR